MKVTLADINAASIVLADRLEPTPLIVNEWLSKKYECDIYLKLENMQAVGSFKIRGALNKIASLNKAERKKGVIAASAGNHAQGVAWAALDYKIRATIVMPVNAPLTKVQNTKALGANVILLGDSYEEAYEQARKIEKKTGQIFIHPYEDKHIIAGQGTVGVEVFNQLPQVDILIGAMGGGGLMAGSGLAFKYLRPETKIIGAQASGARSLVESIKRHRLYHTGMADTFADGIRVKKVSPGMLEILNEVIDSVAHADDESIAMGVLVLMEKARIIAEGAGALPVAVLDQLFKKKLIKNKKVVLLICGGNIDVNVLARIIDRGLVVSGRRLRLNVFISDKPGSLHNLTRLVAERGANILQVIHDRDAPTLALSETAVELTVETKGHEHSAELIRALQKTCIKVEFLS